LRLSGGSVDDRHRHRTAYLAIVLEGELEEAGEEGRRRVGPGDVLFHAPFDAHCNYVGARGVKILNLPWFGDTVLPPLARLDDANAIARLAERDAFEAGAAAAGAMIPKPDRLRDWPDLLADRLREPNGLSLHDWAERIGLAPETLSRGFKKLYRVSPVRYRLEHRARKAWLEIVHTTSPLADIALKCGFADQAHMCRQVGAVTGRSPAKWRLRTSNAFKTIGAASP
jgi:AraC-like DNA-binding protein